jgi:MinD superfamily P-loop ATPase
LKIAVLSGKGGVGKTLVSTNLTNILSKYTKIELLDCDVEEPNSNIFFNFEFNKKEKINLLVPEIDNQKCTKCGLCADSCQFGAINVFNHGVMVFNSLCHGCGVCSIVCPHEAISEKEKSIGTIEYGQKNNIYFGQGLLNIGEPSGVKIIRTLKKHSKNINLQILDAPPGASCSVVETLKNMNYAIIVTESTPFGFHDMKSVIEICQKMGLKMGIIINRYDKDYTEIEEYLNKNNIEILEKIPFSKEIALMYSKGELISQNDKYKTIFQNILNKIGVVQ